jgi:hypothetical protein
VIPGSGAATASIAALGTAPGQYSTTGLPGEPVAPIIFNGAQTNAP